MATIKFSHEYEKMPWESEYYKDYTRLLEVFKADSNDLSKVFKEYDTLIKDKDPSNPKSYYPLPKGTVIILLLQTDRFVWTTVRRWTADKEKYYRGLRGQYIIKEITYDI